MLFSLISGSFWWRAIINLAVEWRAITKCKVGSGTSILFWSDLWHDIPMDIKFPRLYSYARDKLNSIRDILELSVLSEAFLLSLSVEAYEEYNELQLCLHEISLGSTADVW